MSHGKPVVIAVAVAGLALAANSAAAAIAVAMPAPPQATAFGLTGLAAAFIGLVTTVLWAWPDAPPQPARRRVFSPWVPPREADMPLSMPEPPARIACAYPLSPPESTAAPAGPDADGRVIYLADWLKTHGVQRANA